MRISGVTSEKQRCRPDDPALLVTVHGSRGRRKPGAAATANLDEHHAAGIEHHQVQFAATRAEVAGEQPESVAPQQFEGSRLGQFA